MGACVSVEIHGKQGLFPQIRGPAESRSRPAKTWRCKYYHRISEKFHQNTPSRQRPAAAHLLSLSTPFPKTAREETPRARYGDALTARPLPDARNWPRPYSTRPPRPCLFVFVLLGWWLVGWWPRRRRDPTKFWIRKRVEEWRAGAEAAVCVMVVPRMDLGGDHHHSVGTAQSLAVAGYGGARVA